ncbi:hypothetical protein BDV96DRAFT_608210 [Lophiotrema nucula]|uniref:Uncharacterized protein n=1 Tax=Lophiotrema nucula TaxID=690887 RepID=A0A6A5YDZ8_9PLEO|nr:hypothetical protein BDV96DRAFT_608210 [Lophiotrema nucula]
MSRKVPSIGNLLAVVLDNSKLPGNSKLPANSKLPVNSDFDSKLPVDFSSKLPVNPKLPVNSDSDPKLPVNFDFNVKLPVDFNVKLPVDFSSKRPVEFGSKLPIQSELLYHPQLPKHEMKTEVVTNHQDNSSITSTSHAVDVVPSRKRTRNGVPLHSEGEKKRRLR